MMVKMSDEEKMKAVEMNKSLCICGGCPSYNDCAKDKGEALYCSLGASPDCIKEASICICGRCPVHRKWGLKTSTFARKDLRKSKEECNKSLIILNSS